MAKDFLTTYADLDSVFTPEEFDDVHTMIASTTEKFVVNEVFTALPKINEKQFDEVERLIREAAELGLVGADIPEEDGGLDLGKVSGALISEKMALGHSFSITFGGQTGIGALPIAYFGNEDQKERYLEDILTGEKIAAYALTEPSSGTDALGLKTTAVLQEDGETYVLNGEKQWITNAAFADIFIVYAKIDGDQVTAFIVDGDAEGLSTSNEEDKMGLHGSSTRSVILDNVKVNKNNLIGEIGKGHHIAFNVLNIGRYKISATSLGSAKRSLELALTYGNERKQFQQRLNDFGLIQHKLAHMAADIFAVESSLYRIANDMQVAFEQKGDTSYAKVIAPFALDCSVSKVLATEALDFVVDEALQIHGGYGYMKDYEIESIYRDVRINRIFEGTNEINRVIIASTLMKELDQTDVASFESEVAQPLFDQLTKAKQIVVTVMNAMQKEGKTNMNVHQSLANYVANSAVKIFAMESVLFRLEKAARAGQDHTQMKAYAQLYVTENIDEFATKTLQILSNLQDHDVKRDVIALFDVPTFETVALERQIASQLVEKERYFA